MNFGLEYTGNKCSKCREQISKMVYGVHPSINADAPKISLDIDFESNHAFFFAFFVLLCAMGWAIRDHRRRKLEAMVSQQEDRLYMAVLSILFLICILGSYYAFRRQVSSKVELFESPRLQRRIEEVIAEKLRKAELEEAELQNDPIRIAFIVVGGLAFAGMFLFVLWFFARRGQQVQTQAAFAPRTMTPRENPFPEQQPMSGAQGRSKMGSPTRSKK